MASPETQPPPSPEPVAPPPRKLPWLRRTRARRVIARTLGWSFILLILLLTGAGVGLKLYLTSERLRSLLIDQVAKQTGGRLTIGALSFDLLTGLDATQVAFTPPLVGDSRGVLEGGALEPAPLATVKALRLHYSIPKLLAGRLEVRALQLVEPEIKLRQTDGLFNFAGIEGYRKLHVPGPKELVGPPAPEPEKSPEAKGKGLLPFDPSLIYLPLHLLVEQVGVQDLRFALHKEEAGVVIQKIEASGLSLAIGATWFGNDSQIWAYLSAHPERRLQLKIDQEPEVHVPLQAPARGLVHTLAVDTALGLRLQITDLLQVQLDLATRLAKLATPAAGYEDLQANLKMDVGLEADLKTLRIETAQIEVADALNYNLAGSVAVFDNRFAQFSLKLAQDLDVDLAAAARLAKPFMPALKASGSIAVEHLKIDGTLEPEAFKKAPKDLVLPYVSGVLWLREVFFDLPDTGLTMRPIAASLSLAAGPALGGGGGSQVDLALDLNAPELSMQRQTALGKITAGVDQLAAKIIARGLWPQIVVPILKVDIEAAHVRASGSRIAPVDVPLFIDIDAQGRQDQERLGLNAALELTGLAEVNAMIDCQNSCQRLRSSLQTRLGSLAKLHAMVLPLSDTLKLGAVLPTRLSGAVDLSIGLRGTMPDPRTTPVPELLAKADVDVSTELHIARLSAKLPMDDIDVKGVETRLVLSGTTHEQKLDFTQKVESLAMVLPPAKPGGE